MCRQTRRLPTLGLTESDPGRHLAERRHVWVVALGVKVFQALVDKRLQHGQPRPGAGLGPLRLPDRAVDVQGGQRLLPVDRLRGESGRRAKRSEVTLQGASPETTLLFREGSLTLAVCSAAWGCFSTRGKSVRKSGNCLVIFPRMVRAAYSCFGDATQQGTMLWASTCKRKREEGVKNVGVLFFLAFRHRETQKSVKTNVRSTKLLTCMRGTSFGNFFSRSSNHFNGSLRGEKSVTTAPRWRSDTKPGRTSPTAPCSRWNWIAKALHSC